MERVGFRGLTVSPVGSNPFRRCEMGRGKVYCVRCLGDGSLRGEDECQRCDGWGIVCNRCGKSQDACVSLRLGMDCSDNNEVGLSPVGLLWSDADRLEFWTNCQPTPVPDYLQGKSLYE